MEIHTGESSLQQLSSMRNSVLGNSGFTMIELLMVMAIIGVLATMSYSTLGEIRNNTRIGSCVSEIRTIEKDIFAYATEKGTFPPDLAAIGKAGYLDPWGNSYIYKLAPADGSIGPFNRSFGGELINVDFDLYSKGIKGDLDPDGLLSTPEGADDIIRGKDGSYAGLAERYNL